MGDRSQDGGKKKALKNIHLFLCKLRRNVMKMKIDWKKEKQKSTSESERVFKERQKNETKVERANTCLTLHLNAEIGPVVL